MNWQPLLVSASCALAGLVLWGFSLNDILQMLADLLYGKCHRAVVDWELNHQKVKIFFLVLTSFKKKIFT